ncbi:MAG: hypothetical protein JJ863_25190 [Deltaproteobacteria bacterium]|nr:hypothetical protein [Deltaproteobacteria bacterium]
MVDGVALRVATALAMLGLALPTAAQDSVVSQNAASELEDAEPVDATPTPEAEDERVRRKVWIPAGVTLGWLGNRDDHAFVVGAEVSLVWVAMERNRSPGGMFPSPEDGGVSYGLVLDAVWVSNPSHFRAALGAEVMVAFGPGYFAGLEVGATFHTRGDAVGFRTRGFFTFFWPTIYAGIDYHGRIAGEVGLLVKVPFGT